MYVESTFAKTIKILDSKSLNYIELSGLAYRDNKLYVVANDGKLYTFSLKIKNQKITELREIKRTLLKTKKAKVLKKKSKDAEGICFFEDNLLISFEKKHRVDLYSLEGKKLKSVKIHKDLQNKNAYKEKNKGLESVAYHKKYGVITAPESPLHLKSRHIIYAKDKTWKFKARGDITALEFINEDELLVMLREKNSITKQKSSSLYLVDLRESKMQDALFLLKRDGNFEGLTKVYQDYYLMVSDSEGGMFDKAQLVLFELRD